MKKFLVVALSTFLVVGVTSVQAAKKKEKGLRIPAKFVKSSQELQPIPEPPNGPITEAPGVPPIQSNVPPNPVIQGPIVPHQGQVIHGNPLPPATPQPQYFSNSAPHYEPAACNCFCPKMTCAKVKYKDLHEKHPCAVEKMISVPDPCWRRGCGKPRTCVTVKICVPPCECERVLVGPLKRRMRLCYGRKYAVSVRVKRGYIEVDYQD